MSIQYVLSLSMDDVVNYIRENIPEDEHFELTEYESRLLMLRILDEKGELDEHSSRIIRTPYFGELYVKERGDMGRILLHLGFDVLI